MNIFKNAHVSSSSDPPYEVPAPFVRTYFMDDPLLVLNKYIFKTQSVVVFVLVVTKKTWQVKKNSCHDRNMKKRTLLDTDWNDVWHAIKMV